MAPMQVPTAIYYVGLGPGHLGLASAQRAVAALNLGGGQRVMPCFSGSALLLSLTGLGDFQVRCRMHCKRSAARACQCTNLPCPPS